MNKLRRIANAMRNTGCTIISIPNRIKNVASTAKNNLANSRAGRLIEDFGKWLQDAIWYYSTHSEYLIRWCKCIDDYCNKHSITLTAENFDIVKKDVYDTNNKFSGVFYFCTLLHGAVKKVMPFLSWWAAMLIGALCTTDFVKNAIKQLMVDTEFVIALLILLGFVVLVLVLIQNIKDAFKALKNKNMRDESLEMLTLELYTRVKQSGFTSI